MGKTTLARQKAIGAIGPGRAALALQRKAVLIDLGYSDLQERRTDGVQVQMVEVLE